MERYVTLFLQKKKKEIQIVVNDETMRIINKPNHQKRKEGGGIRGTKWKDPHPRSQKNQLRR